MPGAKTYTVYGLQKLTELELVRDEICGLYGQDCRSIYDIPQERREYFTSHLDRVLEQFDAWREKYGETLP